MADALMASELTGMGGGVMPDTEAFPYQRTFDAIAAATRVTGGMVNISVSAFREAFGASVTAPTPAGCICPPSTNPTCPRKAAGGAA